MRSTRINKGKTGKELLDANEKMVVRSFKYESFKKLPIVDWFVRARFSESDIVSSWCDWLEKKKVPHIVVKTSGMLEIWKKQIIFDWGPPVPDTINKSQKKT